MDMDKVMLQAAAFWLVLTVIGVGNGIARGLYAPLLDNDDLAHQVSTFTGIAFMSMAIYYFLTRIAADYVATDLVIIGAMWLTLTVAFEFAFGHYVMGHSLDYLLADYNLMEGRLWPLVLLTVAIGPYLIDRFLVD
jgi:hypothetical protein